jgi:hypothetical protein
LGAAQPITETGEIKAEVPPLPEPSPGPDSGSAPHALKLQGEGVSLYYLVPASRVQKLLPQSTQPHPGPAECMLRVDCIRWRFLPGPQNRPLSVTTFTELGYRLELRQGSQRVSYPLRLYVDQPAVAQWAWQKGFNQVQLLAGADVNYSPFMHFFQFRKEEWGIAVVMVKPRLGLQTQALNLFRKGNDQALWQGADTDFYPNTGHYAARQLQSPEITTADLKSVLFKELIDWKILTREESIRPKRVLLAPSIQWVWEAHAQK